MKIPDKIFVSSDPFGFMSGYYMENHPPHGEEYIRKDVLMEWAKKKNKRIDTEDGDYSLGYVSAMIDLIDKIESL